MNADDVENALAALMAGIRTTLQAELSSIWLPAQLGVILAATLVGAVIAALVRRRFDLVSATMGWPAYLRLAVRAVIDNFGVLVFIVAVWIARAGILATADHPRIYLLDVAVNLATAWVVIAVLASMIRDPFVNRVVAVSAWTHRGAEHRRPARRHGGGARLARDRARRPADYAAARAQDHRAAAARAVGRDRRQQFPRAARAGHARPHAVGAGAGSAS